MYCSDVLTAIMALIGYAVTGVAVAGLVIIVYVDIRNGVRSRDWFL